MRKYSKNNSYKCRYKGRKNPQLLTFKTKYPTSGKQGYLLRYPYLLCQPLNEGWERVDSGSTPSCYSGTLHTPGLALPSQHVLHYCFQIRLSISAIKALKRVDEL